MEYEEILDRLDVLRQQLASIESRLVKRESRLHDSIERTQSVLRSATSLEHRFGELAHDLTQAEQRIKETCMTLATREKTRKKSCMRRGKEFSSVNWNHTLGESVKRENWRQSGVKKRQSNTTWKILSALPRKQYTATREYIYLSRGSMGNCLKTGLTNWSVQKEFRDLGSSWRICLDNRLEMTCTMEDLQCRVKECRAQISVLYVST